MITRSCVGLCSRSVTARTLNTCGKLEVERAALYTEALRCKWAEGRSRSGVPQEVRPVVPVTTSSHGHVLAFPLTHSPEGGRQWCQITPGGAHPRTSGCMWVFL